jgi:hypothetical protein
MAAQFLTAQCIRLANKRFSFISKKMMNTWKDGLTKMEKIEKAKSYYQLRLPKIWIPGGPFYSYYEQSSPRRLTDFWWRPGFGFTYFNYINKCIIGECMRSILTRGKVENILMFT